MYHLDINLYIHMLILCINELILYSYKIKMSSILSEQLIDIYSKQNIDNSIELAKYIGKTECGFSDIELKYLERFWGPIFNELDTI